MAIFFSSSARTSTTPTAVELRDRSIMDIYRDVVEFTGATPSKNLLDRTPAEWDHMWGRVGR